jgi:tetratricopeptide (TPR) repeat protein
MMGTPAYMAPEQFLGTATDARTDQFAFCISLYEALYGERPFSGNTMFALTSNVVQGNVRDAPGNSKVPAWVRKILLRGLRPHADERWPSMVDIIEALGKNPAVKRRKWAIAGAVAVAIVGAGLGVRASLMSKRSICSGGPAKLEGIWELRATGEDETPRQAQIHKAFLATGKGYAADVYATVSRALTSYAQNWATRHKEACEATQIRREQSEEVMDLRMTCLTERLGGLRALTDVFVDANGDVVENAVSAANSLGSLDRCADVQLLRAVIRPPEDMGTREKVAELRDRLASEKASFDAGRWKEVRQGLSAIVSEARKLGYQPLVAESLLLMGTVAFSSHDTPAAEQVLKEAYLTADASRHDEVRAEAATGLVWVTGYMDRRPSEAQQWADEAQAVLRRLGGHELLQAWLLNDLGVVKAQTGDNQSFLRLEQEAIALKQKALGLNHPDVGISEGNLANALQELGRSQEALGHIDRAVAILESGLGAGHPRVGIQLNNRGETLNSLGRHREARQSFERARIIWERELGSEDPNLGYALSGIGISYLAEGDSSSALVPLERALKIREASEKDPTKLGETRFALARALWESNRDRARARTLAEEARTSFSEATQRKNLMEVAVWLRAHGTI